MKQEIENFPPMQLVQASGVHRFWTLSFLLLEVIPEKAGLVGEVEVGVES